MRNSTFQAEFMRQVKRRGYTTVMAEDVVPTLKRLEQENYVGLFGYWRAQAARLTEAYENWGEYTK